MKHSSSDLEFRKFRNALIETGIEVKSGELAKLLTFYHEYLTEKIVSGYPIKIRGIGTLTPVVSIRNNNLKGIDSEKVTVLNIRFKRQSTLRKRFLDKLNNIKNQ